MATSDGSLELGPTGRAIAENVRRIRKGQGMSLRELAGKLESIGRPLSLSALSKLENEDRRVDSDDLVAIAIALDVAPIALLFPVAGPAELVEVTGARVSSALLWQWAIGSDALDASDRRGFQSRSLPSWFTDVGGDIQWDGTRLELFSSDDSDEPKLRMIYERAPRGEIDG